MSSGNTQVRYTDSFGTDPFGYPPEGKKYPIHEEPSHSSKDALSYLRDSEPDSTPRNDLDGIRLINDGNPFPEDPNAPEETAQLTVRAVLIGSILGLIVGASNVYLGLKTGM